MKVLRTLPPMVTFLVCSEGMYLRVYFSSA